MDAVDYGPPLEQTSVRRGSRAARFRRHHQYCVRGSYSASKAFLLILTEPLPGELAGTGVKLQAVLPGLTRTEIFERVGGSFDNLDQNMVMVLPISLMRPWQASTRMN
ncbi:NAD(P)-dependent dehydrogenase (short-subunit alcohol dehydrogenase family) [Pseudorhizobium tarimense]|uniref:NAD(P)-dependent dehydrogenase (Short-subunit alcohol dehydrogenase family) n=1 Tax=Pseudorhizobium tarimense TaxID=1079109 RepID=A0ABV2HDT7_9HYPH|nr:SDR family NAD(P)-dependent oxidoreductase [Pseudorhizobium tarimense]MCJ8521705.1 SDR family NAD(P)-dependent oxidoreductase [Pseudorhizobium tarimense]